MWAGRIRVCGISSADGCILDNRCKSINTGEVERARLTVKAVRELFESC
jgi:hypothetical protein